MEGWAPVLPGRLISQNQGEVTQAGSQSAAQGVAGSVVRGDFGSGVEPVAVAGTGSPGSWAWAPGF